MARFLLVARMEFDDIPLRLFDSEVALGHWLQCSEGTFEDIVSEVAEKLSWPASELVSIEAVKFDGIEPVEVIHVMTVQIKAGN